MKESAVVFGDLNDPASRVAAVGRHARGRALVPLRIGELAAATQVTRDTLRYYERLGLLTTPTRTSGGFFRLYGHEAPEQVRFVKQAQALGLELSEIR